MSPTAVTAEDIARLRSDLAANTAAQASLATKIDKKPSRRLVAGLAISVVLDLLLSVGFFVALHRTNEAQAALSKVNAAAKTQCLTNNDQATKQHQLWNGLLSLPSSGSPPDPTILAAFNKLLDETFAQADCSKAGG